ncbi:MAG: AI-2E family transporter [Prevotellaceae bacterium]|jgi:predicted PurR-regulated permease PerM|nr:AI-2E family transporter [Prevotellaceae bacterium]
MNETSYTFDRFVRLLVNIAIVVGVFFLIKYLSGVLLPFLIGWLIAYLMFPLVKFIQFKLRIKNRIISILMAFLLVTSIIACLLWIIVPIVENEIARVVPILINYVENIDKNNAVSDFIAANLQKITLNISYNELFSFESLDTIVEKILPKFWTLISGTLQFAMGIVIVFMIILYVIFMLKDFEQLNYGIVGIFKPKYRKFVNDILEDLSAAMNQYFRGQALISLITGILYCIGFSIIGLPMAVAMGIFIGMLHLVPYMQTIGFVPVVFLAFLKSIETGNSFLVMILGISTVFVTIQITLDLLLTPKIMGKNMGLNPAVILLSLSVWGALLGLIGLILALPLTTLIISYYKRFVTGNEKLP